MNIWVRNTKFRSVLDIDGLIRGRHERYPSKFKNLGYYLVPGTGKISEVGYRWVLARKIDSGTDRNRVPAKFSTMPSPGFDHKMRNFDFWRNRLWSTGDAEFYTFKLKFSYSSKFFILFVMIFSGAKTYWCCNFIFTIF